MRLTRRDALAALATAGVTSAAGCVGREADGIVESATATLVASAAVVYPSEVADHESFVRTYVEGRTSKDPERRRGIETTTAALNDAATAWYDDRLPALSVGRREAVLREVGADTADPDPSDDAPLADRVRFYVVNELLYALYTSPAGGRLAGVENPVGHPGGVTSYRQGPDP